MNYLKDDLPQRLADEYVLGSLSTPARRRFERLMREHRVFREAKRAAEGRWHPLAETLPPMQPSAAVWDGIMQRINTSGATPKRSTAGWLWRGWALAASLLLLAVLIFPLNIADRSPGYVVVITNDVDATAGWLISPQIDANVVKVESLTTHRLPEGRVFQLWVKSPDRPQVDSVGLIAPSGEIALKIDPDMRDILSRAVLFGVSVEPLGGSPTGQPTTKPLFHGEPRSI